MEKYLKKCIGITLLYTRNEHNVVNQLFSIKCFLTLKYYTFISKYG